MTINEKFEQFDKKNPHVFKMFVDYALQAKSNGYDKFSAKAVFERLRWYYAFETTDYDFKLNNNYTAYYARKAMGLVPELNGFFEIRERKV